MNQLTIIKIVLWISGLIAILVGSSLLIIPVTFYKVSGVELGENINLLNDLRATGGSIFGCGIIIITGVFNSKLTFTSLIVSMLLYLSYGLSRFIAMSIDGLPSVDFIIIAFLEIVVGIASYFALQKFNYIKKGN